MKIQKNWGKYRVFRPRGRPICCYSPRIRQSMCAISTLDFIYFARLFLQQLAYRPFAEACTIGSHTGGPHLEEIQQ